MSSSITQDISTNSCRAENPSSQKVAGCIVKQKQGLWMSQREKYCIGIHSPVERLNR